MSLFPTSVSEIEGRLSRTITSAVDERGQQILPNPDVPGTPAYNVRRVMALALQPVYSELNAALDAATPARATGVDLDNWAEFFGLPRGAAGVSKGRVQITSALSGAEVSALYGGTGSHTFPAGTTFRTSTQVLETTEDAVLAATAREVSVRVQMTAPGPRQLSAGTVVQPDVSNGLRNSLRVVVTEDIAGGSSAESDDLLRHRVVRSLRGADTAEGYRTRLIGSSDVADVSVVSGAYGPGTVEAFVVPTAALPEPGLRGSLEALHAGPGRAYVVFPDYQGVALKIRVRGSASAAAVASFVNNLDLGADLVLNAVEALVQNAGASDAQVIAIRRGAVSEDGALVDARLLANPTNLPGRPRTKWYTVPEWITICAD